ncbi:MAG: glycosyltransferase [Methanobrevibacter sp.]|jgi:glycosyltransferase involved in cell wall biosynthesis|nr:glycosyltransferase [Methanobrevibacter sp.]
MNPKISVIIPTHNAEDVIGETVDSVINQSFGFENIELMLVDHKSSDSTPKILKKYENDYPNIKSFLLPKNLTGTPGYPRNFGMEHSNCEYIMFMDADDLFEKDMCETLFKLIDKTGVDFISCRYKILSGDKIKRININFLEKYGKCLKFNSILELPEIVYSSANMSIWNKIFRKKFLEDNNIKYNNIRMMEDTGFMADSYMASKNFIILNGYAGYIYRSQRDSGASISHSPSKKYLISSANGIMEEYYKAKKTLVDYTPHLNEALVNLTVVFLDNEFSIEEQKNILKILKPMYNQYKWNFRFVNVSLPINILINIFMVFFKSNFYIGLLMQKSYKFLSLKKIVDRMI